MIIITQFQYSNNHCSDITWILTHWGLVKSYGGMNFGNIASGNGLMPDGTKLLHEPKLTYHQYAPLKHISWPFVSHIRDENKFEYKVFKMSPGPNELRHLRSPETWLYIEKKSSAICHAICLSQGTSCMIGGLSTWKSGHVTCHDVIVVILLLWLSEAYMRQ